MNWLVTGGCGFIGTRLIARLLADPGHAIRVLDNLSAAALDDLGEVCRFTTAAAPERFPKPGGPVEVVVGDIRSAGVARQAAKGADVIVHLAANTGVLPSIENPPLDCDSNVVGILSVLEAARVERVKRFVFASSGAALGDQVPPIHEEKVPKPVSPYGASKLAGEAYCHVYHSCFGIQTVSLRFGNVYGPGSVHKGSAIAKFIKQVLDGAELSIYGDGSQTRDFIYVEDLLDAIVRAAALDSGGQVFQISGGKETTINEIVTVLSRVFADFGHTVRFSHEPPKVGEVKRSFADVSRARDVLGWSAKRDLATGIRQTVEWFLERRRAAPPR